MKKINLSILIISLLFLIFSLSYSNINAHEVEIDTLFENDITYDLSSNFFEQKENTRQVISKDISFFIDKGYKKIAENNYLELYLLEESLNIAVLIKETSYIFFTDYNYYQYDISAYYTTSKLVEVSSTIPIDGKYKVSIDQLEHSPILKYTKLTNGFKCEFTYENLGISYNLYVTLNDDKINVLVPKEEVIEKDYTIKETKLEIGEDGNPRKVEITTSHTYLIESLSFFMFFGSSYSDNSTDWLNGYTFIPDGSGALIRYQNSKAYKTAYVKDVYSKDDGIDDVVSSTIHIKEESNLTLPIFGINHGYRQNAFLCVIKNNEANAKLHSNPYGYLNRKLENTYFQFYFRQKYNIVLSTGNIQSVNKDSFNDTIEFEYSFLTNNKASYSGMANLYKDNYLTLLDSSEQDNISINLDVLAQDYKRGLFGKNFQEMTSYSELLDIIKELESYEVNNFNINYLGFSRGGFYNNKNFKPRVSYNLGSKRKLMELIDYMSLKGYSLNSYIDPLSTFNQSDKSVTKKINLSTFKYSTNSSLFDNSYFLKYDDISEKITKYNKQYNKFNINDVTLINVGDDLNSYRYKNNNYYKDSNIDTIKSELKSIKDNGYNIGLNKANSYTFEYLSKYYLCDTESSNYNFITDSVPFISMILKGHVTLYSNNVNYIDDYLKNALRLIEYGIYPSFIITKEDSSKLRYTNYEYLYCSEYDRWKDIIISYYININDALKDVIGYELYDHLVIDNGVYVSIYEKNGNYKSVIINYTDNDYSYNGNIVKSKGFLVGGWTYE